MPRTSKAKQSIPNETGQSTSSIQRSSPSSQTGAWKQQPDETLPGRIYFNFGDLGRAIPKRQKSRIVWLALPIAAVTILLWAGALISFLIGSPIALILLVLGLIAFTGGIIVIFVLPSWIVGVPAGEYHIEYEPPGIAVNVHGQGYKWISPTHTMRHFRDNVIISLDLEAINQITVDFTPLRLTGFLEFRYNPVKDFRNFMEKKRQELEKQRLSNRQLNRNLRAARLEFLEELLAITDAELLDDVKASIFDAFRSHMRSIPREQVVSHVFELIDSLVMVLQDKAENGIKADTRLINLQLPPEVLSANIEEWAQRARAKASTYSVLAHLAAAGQVPTLDNIRMMRLLDGRLSVRMYNRGENPLLAASQPSAGLEPDWADIGNLIAPSPAQIAAPKGPNIENPYKSDVPASKKPPSKTGALDILFEEDQPDPKR
jgi:hypothetical protein